MAEVENADYVPGVCNIGPAEIAARKRAGLGGLVLSVVVVVILWATHADPLWRLTLFFTASGAASGYLQARYRFCANFGLRGRYNFSEVGRARRVEDPVARAADRLLSLKIGLGSVGVGLVVALIAYALP